MRRPNATVLAVFVLVTLIGGSNFVPVRLSNRELAPFWGAGLRFAIHPFEVFGAIDIGPDRLDGHDALKRRVDGLVHRAHAALT